MRKLITFLVAVIAMSATLFAADLQPSQNDKGKWGFVNASGTPVVEYKYDAVVPFDGQFAKVCKKDKWGYVNLSGTEVLKPEYEEITDFDEGLARVNKGGKYGFINQNMEFVIPCKFSLVGSFNKNGLILVKDGNKNGIYRKDGSIFIEPKYNTVGIFVPWQYNYKEKNFEKSSYAYKSHYRLNGSHHLYRKHKLETGLFEKLPEDVIGYYYSTDAAGYKNSVVDPNGKVLVEAGKYYTPFYPTDGIVPVVIKTGKFNYLDLATGKWLLSKDVYDGWAFHDGVALVQVLDGKKKKWQMINILGNYVSDVKYDDIFPKSNDVYITLKDDRYGMLDRNGKTLLQPEYRMIVATTGKYFGALKSQGDLYGFLNSKGQWQIEPCYTNIGAYPHGYYCVQKEGNKWGMIDGDGNSVIDCAWVDMKVPSKPNQELFWVTDESGDGRSFQVYSFSKKGIAFDGKYQGPWNYDDHFPGVALVHNGTGKYGCIDTQGNVIIPLELDDFDMVKAGYNMLQERANKSWRPIDTHRIKLSGTASKNAYRLSQKLSNDNWEY